MLGVEGVSHEYQLEDDEGDADRGAREIRQWRVAHFSGIFNSADATSSGEALKKILCW